MAPRNKRSRISTSATHQDEETSNRATLAVDATAMMAEMMKHMEEHKNQVAAAMEMMQKWFEW